MDVKSPIAWFLAVAVALFWYHCAPVYSSEGSRAVRVSTLPALREALDVAMPGDVIEVADGEYRLAGNLTFTAGGTAERPITVRARNRGKVVISVLEHDES